jgi:RNA recognition motif-containing protein
MNVFTRRSLLLCRTPRGSTLCQSLRPLTVAAASLVSPPTTPQGQIRYNSSSSTTHDNDNTSTWLSTTDYEINEAYTESNAFGKKKTENGFGRVLTPPRPSDSLTTPHVFVTNLRKGTTYQLVRQHMSAAGEVKYARVYTKQEKEYSNAMVEYFNIEDARKALTEMHGSELEGNTLWVREFRDRELTGHSRFY